MKYTEKVATDFAEKYFPNEVEVVADLLGDMLDKFAYKQRTMCAQAVEPENDSIIILNLIMNATGDK